MEEAARKAVPENAHESRTRGPFGDNINGFEMYNTHTTSNPAGTPWDQQAPVSFS
jgi:hypothetical protein